MRTLKKLNKPVYRFFKKELESHKHRGTITQTQLDDMMAFYEEGYGISFIRVLVTIGAILLGLGVILFIASNWDDMSRFLKVLVIITGIGSSLFTSYRLEKNYPKTSEAFLYLTVLLYGAGIFLIQQTFNISDQYFMAFLIWAIGALGMAYIYEKTLLFIFAQVLVFSYFTANVDKFIIPIGLIFIGLFYYLNKYFKFQKVNTFLTTGLTMMFLLLNVLFYYEVDGIYNSFIYLGIGLAFYYIKHDLNRDVFKFMGLITIGIGGFALSFKYLWEQLPFISNGNIYSIVFGILFIIYLLSLVEKRQIIPLLWICVMIIRYYFDQLYDLLPKSLFFIIGGAMILGFGYYIERFRKGGFEDEKLS